jgi:hypothetical protein
MLVSTLPEVTLYVTPSHVTLSWRVVSSSAERLSTVTTFTLLAVYSST